MRSLILLYSIFFFSFLSAQNSNKVDLFELEEVTLLDGIFLNAQKTDLKYMLTLEPDRLLAPFLREAGLTQLASSYTNWENTGLDGHIGGHYLSALSMMYATSKNEEVKMRLDYMIKELKRCQDAIGTGFLGGTPGGIPMWNEIKNGNINAAKFSLNDKWVPLYNIHKTCAGLRDAYLYTGNTTARKMLIKLTDWMIDVTSELNEDQMQKMLNSEHGGLNEIFADVYTITKEEKYLILAKRFSHRALLDPLLLRQDKLTGLHANTQIPKVIGYKRIADIEHNQDWDAASAFFWKTVIYHRTVSIGGNSVRENFHSSDNFNPMITSVEGPETCNTYNMLRLSKMLFTSSLDTKYLDYYERALYNHILSSQEPENGGFVYFTSMRPAHYRVYSQPETSMWCCVGSGMENHTKYGELIYAHTNESLLVNLFIPSRLKWKEKGFILSQTTSFPNDNRVYFHIEKSMKSPLALSIRCPEWITNHQLVKISINDELVETPIHDNNYFVIERKWKKGDKVLLEFPMELKTEQLPDGSNNYCFVYGPIVLAANMGVEDLEGLYADDSRKGHVAYGKQIPLHETPFLVGNPDQLLMCIEKEENSLSFVYNGNIYPDRYKKLQLIPFFNVHNSRYAIYFQQVSENELEIVKDGIARTEKDAIELANRTLDIIYPGEQQPELDHFIKYKDADTGIQNELHYRLAKGWFSYQLKISDGEKATKIRLLLHKNDSEPKTKLEINGIVINSLPNTIKLNENFVSLEYELAEKLGMGEYILKFSPLMDKPITNRIFEIRLIK